MTPQTDADFDREMAWGAEEMLTPEARQRILGDKSQSDAAGCGHPAYLAVGDDGACIDCPQPNVDKEGPQ